MGYINKKIEIEDSKLIEYVNSGLTSRDIFRLYSKGRYTSRLRKRIWRRLVFLGFENKLKENCNLKRKEHGEKIRYKIDLEKVKKLIILYKTSKEIIEILKIKGKNKNKVLINASKKLGLYQDLKINNSCYKNKSWHPILIKNNCGELIKDLIVNKKFNLKELSEYTKLSKNCLLKFFKYNKDLNLIRKENSKKKIGDFARINGKLSSEKLKGVPLKPFTKKVINLFLKLKKEGIFKTQIKDIIKKEFNFGEKKYYQLCKLYGNPESNPIRYFYGKSPPLDSGYGIKGRIIIDGKELFFRSSLEMKIFYFLFKNKIKFSLSKHRIKYIDSSRKRTYNPDIVINNKIYEIKPKVLIKLNSNILKMNALEKYCKKFNLECGYITEDTYDLKDITLNLCLDLIKNGILIMKDKEIERLKRNL